MSDNSENVPLSLSPWDIFEHGGGDVFAEEFDEGSHEEGGDDGADAGHGAEDRADGDAEEVRGDPDKAEELGNKCVKYACLVMAVCAVLMFIFAPQLVGVFTTDQQAIAMASQALRVQAFAELFVAIANTVSGILRGAGDTKFSSFLSMVGMWGVRVPLAYILIHFFGFSLLGVWLPMALDWTMRCLLMTIRYRRGKWKNVWKPA